MRIQQIWATLIGTASLVIGILSFFPSPHLNIPFSDAIIHIIAGAIFIVGAWIWNGKYVRQTNLLLGVFYTVFGTIGINWPHIIAGIISSIIGFTIKPTRNI